MNKNLVFEREKKKLPSFATDVFIMVFKKNFDQPLAIFHRQKKKNV